MPPTPDSETLAAFAREIKVQKMLLVLLSLVLARMMGERVLHVVWVRTRLVLSLFCNQKDFNNYAPGGADQV